MDVLVADLLQMKSMRWSHVVAGVRGLSRKITGIDVWEIPEIGKHHKPDVLFLSSGYMLRDDIHLQNEIIARLVNANAAGLAIQTGYCTPMPEAMLEQANHYNFPLIELPGDVCFTEVIREGMKQIINRQGDFLRYSQEFHRRLAEVVLAEGDLTDIAKVLASLLKNTVTLVDHDFHILGVGIYSYVDNDTGRIGSYKTGFGIHKLEKLLHTLKKTGFVDRVKKEKKAHRVEFLFSNHGEQAWVVVPVLVKDEIYGFVAILENHRRMEEMEWDALQQACDVIAMNVYKQRAYALLEQKQRQELVFDILDGKLILQEDVMRKTAELGWQLDAEQVIMSLDITDFETNQTTKNSRGNSAQLYNEKEQLLELAASRIKRKFKSLLIVRKGMRLLIICQLKTAGIREKELYQLAEQVRQTAEESLPDGQVVILLSSICRHPEQLRHCYEEAKSLVTIRKCINAKAGVYQQDDFVVQQLLVRLRGTQELRGFYNSILGPLDKLDANARDEMLNTLESYFKENCSVCRAAESIYLHRNSFKYRLRRLSDILGINLEDGETKFLLQLALKARYFLHDQKSLSDISTKE